MAVTLFILTWWIINAVSDFDFLNFTRPIHLTFSFVLYQEFNGNRDQFMPVCYLLKNPIVATHIRIIPLAWHGHIALRAGFYGCWSGKQLHILSLNWKYSIVVKNENHQTMQINIRERIYDISSILYWNWQCMYSGVITPRGRGAAGNEIIN